MGFWSILFLVLLGLYLFGLTVKVLFRMWIVRTARRFQQRQAGGAFRTSGRASARQKPEGDVTVQRTAPPQKRVSKSVGDYVDFEEVD